MFLRKAVQTSSRRFSTAPAFIANTPETLVSKATNGVRVASESGHGETATVAVTINAGSRHGAAGASHLLQHLAFSGKSRNAIDGMGGHFKATSSREHTVYTAKVLKKDIAAAVSVLAEAAQFAAHDDAAVAFASKSADSGNHSYKSSVVDELHQAAFLGTDLGRSALFDGDAAACSAADLNAFVRDHHTASRIVVSAAGAVDHKQLLELTNTHFGKLAAGPKFVETRARFTGSDKRIRYDSMGSAHVAVAFEGASHNSEFLYPLKLIETMYGNWDKANPAARNAGSKMAIDTNNLDLAHQFSAFNSCYADTGLFGVYINAPDNKLEDAMFHVLDNLVRFCHNVGADELRRAKVQLLANTMRGLDSHAHVAAEIGAQVLNHGRRMTHAEIFARVDAMTAEDLKAAANAVVNDEDHALAAIGPIFELPDYNWIRRRSYYNRF